MESEIRTQLRTRIWDIVSEIKVTHDARKRDAVVDRGIDGILDDISGAVMGEEVAFRVGLEVYELQLQAAEMGTFGMGRDACIKNGRTVMTGTRALEAAFDRKG